jgi:hypothetical protein
LPVCGRVQLVESLDATPDEGAYFYRFAGHFECFCAAQVTAGRTRQVL